MTDITANVVVSNPRPIFTESRSFKAVANGKIYIGQIDTDPVNPANQIPVYIENEDGSHVQIAQPLIINSAGKIVYNGQLVKIVTVKGHSMAIYDAYGYQVDYIANVLKYDPDQLRKELSSPGGVELVNGAVSYDDIGSDDGYNIIGEYSQLSELRNASPTVGDAVLVKEHTTGRGVEGGGIFRATPGAIEDDDGVFISSSSPGVHWVRQGSGSHVKIEWFGGASNNQDIDHSTILANAQKILGRSIEFNAGSYYFSPPCIIQPDMNFVGSGGAKTFWRNKNINSDATVFFANTGTSSKWAENSIFERIHFSNDLATQATKSALAMTNVGLFKFNNCGFYNAPIYASDLHFVTWNGCVFIKSPVTMNEDVVSPSFPINEMPSFIDCYMVESPIDITDVTDLHLNNTVMFYGPFGIKSTSHRPLQSGADSRGYPIMITNSTIDNIDGYCLDLNRVALATITNSLFSGGRVSGTAAIRLTEVLGLSFSSNVIHFAGQECMTLYDVQNLLMGNNQFSSCNGYAIKAQLARNVTVNGNFFGNQKVTGGWNTCTGGINFDTNDSLAWIITGNAFVGIPGVAGQTGSGRTVYTSAANSGLADN
ncbi:right-handed parallel beta-helix repeat-containing protein [Salmonella enterica subsp. enterica serovar Cerro]|uniref:Phage tail protein n=1 Tax=Salmonella enterica TaxID=28901 RepID=A0A5T3RRY3_SALER|nr:phage tail protein [Salmonella enterica]EAN7548755.1 phage tail protein [Salmonella enterica subsp. enterica serovar Cerro]EJQ7523768.1 right-handed parallel beta-helix repeat-containing protein [Salmonella enterica subsp. enterica]EAO2867948.1 phage tail protein [Salmonella enterica subsp. enterica serovar Cerro]EAP5533642.1 phage tail protein [Salmonella enterica subsp. enterica serovar Cerro]